MARIGLLTTPQVLVNGVPLADRDLAGDEFESAVFTLVYPQISKMQNALFSVCISFYMPILW